MRARVSSTHYHGLVQDFSTDARVLPMHMACRIEPADGQLVMLYKLQQGVSPQSYGMECGRRAGLPSHIIDRARVKSQEFQAAQHAGVCVCVRVCVREGKFQAAQHARKRAAAVTSRVNLGTKNPPDRY